MWSEGDNYDLALSFQEKAGCDEIWEKICQVSYSERLALVLMSFVKTCQVKFSAISLFCRNRTLLECKTSICLVFNKSIVYRQTLTKSLNVSRLSEGRFTIVVLTGKLRSDLFFLLTFYSADSRERPVSNNHPRHPRGRRFRRTI